MHVEFGHIFAIIKSYLVEFNLVLNGPIFMMSKAEKNMWKEAHKVIRNKETWMCKIHPWGWFQLSTIVTSFLDLCLASRCTSHQMLHLNKWENWVELEGALKVHTLREKQSRLPCSKQATRGQHRPEGSLGLCKCLTSHLAPVTWQRRLIFSGKRTVQSLCSEKIADWDVREVWTRA